MSRIIKTVVQLKGEKEPHQHIALVFDDVMEPADLMFYRNALTMATKAVLISDNSDLYSSELFWLIQLSEYISTALDVELYWKGGDDE